MLVDGQTDGWMDGRGLRMRLSSLIP